jgi:hypothetical protein
LFIMKEFNKVLFLILYVFFAVFVKWGVIGRYYY